MKKIFQNLQNGKLSIENIPYPSSQKNKIIVKNKVSLISPGTEKMLINFGKGNLFSKARQQPDKVKQVFQKISTDGIIPTINSIKDKLSKPIQLGYSCVGEVIESNVSAFKVGDRVVSNGPHSEVVSISSNMCAKVPDEVNDDTAAFTILGAIALQGIRRVNPSLGETVVVIGLGVIGMLAIQILRANGCKVIGIDSDKSRCDLAKKFNIDAFSSIESEDDISNILSMNQNNEVDAVIIAAANSSSNIVNNSAKICRQRGRIVLVGVTGLNLERENFYKKEITFSVSSAYGPGRYDQDYEEKNYKYPYGLIRWSAQRNFEAILTLMKNKQIDVLNLISRKFLLEDASKAYDLLEDKTILGIIIKYRDKVEYSDNINFKINKIENEKNIINGFIGAGNYASKVILPIFRKKNIFSKYIASQNGENANFLAKKFKIKNNTTSIKKILDDKEINSIVIATRHNTHAELVCEGIKKNKHIYVEKPLAIDMEQLNKIKKESVNNKKILMVGFNRRFSPLVRKAKSLIMNYKESISINIRINSGSIDGNSWIQDPETGGGRVVGEVCHFLDLLQYLIDSDVVSYKSEVMESKYNDTLAIILKYRNGSVGNITYYSNGHNLYPKENIEIYVDNKILVIENFKNLKGFGWSKFKNLKLWQQNKGNSECINAYLKSVTDGKESPININDILSVSEIAIKIQNNIDSKCC
jgi:predicted dehydrogenase